MHQLKGARHEDLDDCRCIRHVGLTYLIDAIDEELHAKPQLGATSVVERERAVHYGVGQLSCDHIEEAARHGDGRVDRLNDRLGKNNWIDPTATGRLTGIPEVVVQRDVE